MTGGLVISRLLCRPSYNSSSCREPLTNRGMTGTKGTSGTGILCTQLYSLAISGIQQLSQESKGVNFLIVFSDIVCRYCHDSCASCRFQYVSFCNIRVVKSMLHRFIRLCHHLVSLSFLPQCLFALFYLSLSLSVSNILK